MSPIYEHLFEGWEGNPEEIELEQDDLYRRLE